MTMIAMMLTNTIQHISSDECYSPALQPKCLKAILIIRHEYRCLSYNYGVPMNMHIQREGNLYWHVI